MQKVLPEIAAGSTCIAIFADRGERYLDTIYSEKWVREHCSLFCCCGAWWSSSGSGTGAAFNNSIDQRCLCPVSITT